MTKEAVKKDVQTIGNILNNMSFDDMEFCQQFSQCEHRTIQQNFTRLCVAWLSTCASDDYRVDGRNEASHELAKDLLLNVDAENLYLPMI